MYSKENGLSAESLHQLDWLIETNGGNEFQCKKNDHSLLIFLRQENDSGKLGSAIAELKKRGCKFRFENNNIYTVYKYLALYCLKQNPPGTNNISDILEAKEEEADLWREGMSLANVKCNIIIEMLEQDSYGKILEKLSNDDLQILLDNCRRRSMFFEENHNLMGEFIDEIIKRQEKLRLNVLASECNFINTLKTRIASDIINKIRHEQNEGNYLVLKNHWIDFAPYNKLFQYIFIPMLNNNAMSKLIVIDGEELKQRHFLELIHPDTLLSELNHDIRFNMFDWYSHELMTLFFQQFLKATNEPRVKISVLHYVLKNILHYADDTIEQDALQKMEDLKTIYHNLYPYMDFAGCSTYRDIRRKHYIMEVFQQSTSFLPGEKLHKALQNSILEYKDILEIKNRTQEGCEEFLTKAIIDQVKHSFESNKQEIEQILKELGSAKNNSQIEAILNKEGDKGPYRAIFISFFKNTFIKAIDQIFTKNQAYSNSELKSEKRKLELQRELCLLKKMYPDLDTTDGYPECLKKLTSYEEMQFKFVHYNVEGSVYGNAIKDAAGMLANKNYIVPKKGFEQYIEFLMSSRDHCPHVNEAQVKKTMGVIEISANTLCSLLQKGQEKQDALNNFYKNIIGEKKDAQYDLPQEVQEIYKFIYEQGLGMLSIKPEHFVIELLVLLTAYEEDKKFNIENPGRRDRSFDEFLEVFLEQRLQKPTITIGTEEIPFPEIKYDTDVLQELNKWIEETQPKIDAENARLAAENKKKQEALKKNSTKQT